MRTVVIGALALASGCNWVFGLDPVTLTDAQMDAPDAPLPTVKLSAITPMLIDGAITGQARYVPISPPPQVQYGWRGEMLRDTTINGEDIEVGYDFAESAQTWRLVYTLQGGIPHEVHWKPSATSRPGHAVSLQLTPNDRATPPASGTFHLLATGPEVPTIWFFPRVYTTNTWTLDASPPPNTTEPRQIDSNFTSAFTKPIAGEKRVPDPVKDFEVLLEYDETAAANLCTIATGSAAFRIELANGSSVVQPTWSTSKPPAGTYSVKTGNELEMKINVAAANGLADLNDVLKYQVVTYAPAGGIPLHHHAEPGMPLPVPAGILLAKCAANPADAVPSFNTPTDAALATVGTLAYATKPLPIDGGPMVQNGVEQSVVDADGSFDINYAGVAFATAPAIDGVSITITNATTIAIPAGGATASLDFDLSIDSPVVELYEATLYRVNAGALVPIREFTFTEKPLVFDRVQGQPAGTSYVFAIRVIRGASANAANGDFTVWSGPQSLGLTHTQAFTLD
ncbi:MAG: hypothetical protein AB7T06_02175 [Kofleriaceae bacterium]